MCYILCFFVIFVNHIHVDTKHETQKKTTLSTSLYLGSVKVCFSWGSQWQEIHRRYLHQRLLHSKRNTGNTGSVAVSKTETTFVSLL